MIRRFLSAAALACLSFGSAWAQGPQSNQEDALKIVAVVNDQIISQYDVIQRVRYAQAMTGMHVTKDNFQQIRGQVINTLVDERLESQEAKRENVNVSEEDTNNRIDQISRSINRSRQEIYNFLTANNIEVGTFTNQIHTQLLWQKLVVRRFYAQSAVSQEDVTAALDRLKASVGKPEMQVSEIVLSIDDPSQIDTVMDRAKHFVTEIRGGAEFFAIATQFSQAASAAVGGDLGWVSEGTLSPELQSVLDKMQTGAVSDPVTIGSRIYILGLRSRRNAQTADPMETRLEFRNVVFPAPKNASLAVLSTAHLRADKAQKEITSCNDAQRVAASNGGVVGGDTIQTRAGDLRDPTMREALINGEVGTALPVMQLEDGFHILVLCGRQTPQGGIPTREEIESRLINDQLELKARRYLRDLHRDASIDLK